MGARPSGFAQPIVEVVPTRQWSLQQQAIFWWFEKKCHTCGDYAEYEGEYGPLPCYPCLTEADPHPTNLVVRARAGTGKTTTIIEGVDRAPEAAILVCAFNKRIADELNTRLSNPRAEAKTLHSLGLSLVRREWRGMPVNSVKEHKVYRSDTLTDRAFKASGTVAASVPYQIRRMVTTLHTKAREMCPLEATSHALTALAVQFDLVPDEGWRHYDLEFVVTHALLAMHEAATVPPSYDIGVDYADMIYLPLVWNLTSRDYQLVVVDEAQDMTMAQLEIAERVCGGRIAVVGDDRQCQPAGTMVRSSVDGNVPIESLKVGDTIESFDRHGQVFIKSGKVNQVACRNYEGELIHVVAADCLTRCTPNHKWLVRWSDKSQKAWVTYLMRKGGMFRVGQCQLFRQGCRNFGVSERCRVERADSAWILNVHDTVEQALAYEQVLASRYGLPEMVFYEPSGVKHFTQSVIDSVYSELQHDGIGLYEKALACLKDHGRDICYPIYSQPDAYERRGRTTLFETQACNLLSGYMSVAVAPKVITGHDKRDRHAVAWAPIVVWREDFKGPVYSLDIERYHKYVADGLVTCNSIYSFRGADSGALDRLKAKLGALELPLTTTYRCGANIVAHAQRLVPDIAVGPDNPAGIVDACTPADVLTLVRPGDFVLSRLNAPLVSLTLRLLRNGVRATMAGRDVGAGVLAILRKLKVVDYTPMPQVRSLVEGWERKQVSKLAAMGLTEDIDRIRDQADVLYAFIQDCDTVREMFAKLETLFTNIDGEPSEAVVCSTVHRAKGLESDRVFLLMDTLYRRGDSAEERNVEYVGITRARTHLTLVRQ